MRVRDVHPDVLPVDDSVPQGSSLSVTLFAVAINSVISVLPKGNYNWHLKGYPCGMTLRVFGSPQLRLWLCTSAAFGAFTRTQTCTSVVVESHV